jgi:hypothetical protein
MMRGLPLKRRNRLRALDGTKPIGGRPHSGAGEEFTEHEKLALMLSRHLDPATTFWTSLECRPRSWASGRGQRRRGVRSGIPDAMCIVHGLPPVFIELKSSGGVASKVQKKVAAELMAVGCSYALVRTARAALVALQRSGVPLVDWEPPRLEPHEGPFTDPTQRLLRGPEATAKGRAAGQRWRARERARHEAAMRALRFEQSGTVGN